MPVGAEIIVVDDDPIGGTLTHNVLEESGYATELISDSRQVIAAVKAQRPGLVILDILMPGIDGLTLLHEIKQDPELSDTKVIIVSGKTFAEEKQRALRYGASLFLEKPYEVATLRRQVSELLGAPKGGTPSPRSAAQGVQIRVWGCRSSGAADLRTPCVSVETQSRMIILDAGSGLLPLGEELLKEDRRKELWLLLTHFHPAHVEGLGLFACTRRAGYQLHIGGAGEPDKPLSEFVRGAFERSFERLADPVAAKIKLYEFQEGDYDLLSDLKLSVFYANHPGLTLGFSLQTLGRRIVYCPDSELYGEDALSTQDYDEKLGGLCRGADLLIHDARWRDAEYAVHRNEGHSSARNAAAFAARNEIGSLILFHQDASYSPADLEAMGKEAEAAAGADGRLSCVMAAEGLSLTI